MSSDDNIIYSLWLFNVKEKADGMVNQLKARLVANRIHQVKGKDYNDTFSLVVKLVPVWLVLTVAMSFDWKLMQA